jgi:ribosomal protein S18 acetylase RimI-like enzyme
MIIQPFSPEYEEDVLELWSRCNLLRPWNDPKKDIKRKLEVNPDLFLIGLIDRRVVASIMGGYEGHRGWIYYLAVDPLHEKRGLGKKITKTIEANLKALGCPKINVMVRHDNNAAIGFYQSIGYKLDEVITMSKRLVKD